MKNYIVENILIKGEVNESQYSTETLFRYKLSKSNLKGHFLSNTSEISIYLQNLLKQEKKFFNNWKYETRVIIENLKMQLCSHVKTVFNTIGSIR